MSSGSADDNVADEEACRARLGEHYAFQSAQRIAQDNLEEACNNSNDPTSFIKIDKMDKGDHNVVDDDVARAFKEIKDAQIVKHSFVCMYTGRDWLDKPLHIDISNALMISADGGDWNGAAVYTWHDDGKDPGYGQWELTFHHAADLQKVKKSIFKQIARTHAFMKKDEKNPAYNSILIPSDPPLQTT
jgi:hypothetical protein